LNYLVEVGGEMRFSGSKPNGVPWRIAIEKPDEMERELFRVLEVSNGAVATSGDYRNFFEVDGQKFSHTIDPKTGYPVSHSLASVTVAMENCMDADAFATAFMVMGHERALAFAQQNQIAALFIYKENSEFRSVQSDVFTEQFGQTGS